MALNANGKGRALVTGASSGIGATYARKLAARGYDLVVVARDAARLGRLADELESGTGVDVEVFPADLSVVADLRRVEKRLRAADIELFVNNAGIGPRASLLAGDIDDLDPLIAINVTAANRLAIAAAQAFHARGAGAIVNIASVVALAPHLFNGTYSGSKAFVLSLTQSMASELKDSGVRVQAVLPGLTRTEIFERAGGSVDNLNPAMVMDVDDMVGAALAGLDAGELITIPSMEDEALFESYSAATGALLPQLSTNRPASRYRVG
ncbi:SDR family NAD(P)-dependent oxidoreductase [Pseudomonas sp. R2.Fl]|nr:SDR family NAD(P)-dependent oxidoreductase [Pseudomonas sp. R2.Fl]